MNAVTIVIGSICILLIVYRLYGTFMAAKVLKLDDSKPTPAHELEDGKDYVPTNKWVTFGHHFAAIAAAGTVSWANTCSTVWLFTQGYFGF